MKKMMSFFSGVMMGAIFGATMALLFAPSSGDDLRARVQEEATRVQEEVKKAAQERRAELEAQLETLRAPQKVE